MGLEENKAVARRLYELLDGKDYEGLPTLVAADFVDHDPYPGQGPGIEGAMEVVHMFANAFPDYGHAIEDQIAEGDRVMTKYVWWGTHQGELEGLAPTGRQVKVRGIEIVRVVNGKVKEIWRLEDNYALMQQLGAIPEAGGEER